MKKPRKFTPELKAHVVLQVLTGAKSAAQVCREHQLNENLLSRWKKEFIERAALVFGHEQQSAAADERVAELERLCGRLTLELEAAKKAWQSFGSLASRSGRS